MECPVLKTFNHYSFDFQNADEMKRRFSSDQNAQFYYEIAYFYSDDLSP